MKKLILAAMMGVIFLLGLTGIAPATTYHTSTEVDLVNDFSILTTSSANVKYFRSSNNFILDTPFWAGKGDKIIVDVTFANNKALKIYNSEVAGESSAASIYSTAQGSHSTTSSGYTDLLGTNGSLLENHISSILYTDYNYAAHSAFVFTDRGGNKNLTDSWFSFTGMRLEIDIHSLLNGDFTQSVEAESFFDRAWFQFGGGDFEVITASSTPAPGAITLLGAGLLGLTGLRRKNEQAVSGYWM